MESIAIEEVRNTNGLKEIFEFSWKAFVKTPLPFVAGVFAVGAVQVLPYVLIIPLALIGLGVLVPFVAIATLLASMLVTLGIIRMAVKASVELKPEFSDLYAPWRQLWKYALASILLFVAFWFVTVAFGLVFSFFASGGANPFLTFIVVIVPYTYLFARFFYYPYFIVDKEEGPIECLKSSWAYTKGLELPTLVALFLLVLFNFAGALVFGLGIIVTAPVSAVVIATMYRNMVAV